MRHSAGRAYPIGTWGQETAPPAAMSTTYEPYGEQDRTKDTVAKKTHAALEKIQTRTAGLDAGDTSLR